MASTEIPVGIGAFTPQTVTVSSGRKSDIPAGITGNLTIDGAADVTASIICSLPGYNGTSNDNAITVCDVSRPAVNTAANVAATPYNIDAIGDSLMKRLFHVPATKSAASPRGPHLGRPVLDSALRSRAVRTFSGVAGSA